MKFCFKNMSSSDSIMDTRQHLADQLSRILCCCKSIYGVSKSEIIPYKDTYINLDRGLEPAYDVSTQTDLYKPTDFFSEPKVVHERATETDPISSATYISFQPMSFIDPRTVYDPLGDIVSECGSFYTAELMYDPTDVENDIDSDTETKSVSYYSLDLQSDSDDTGIFTLKDSKPVSHSDDKNTITDANLEDDKSMGIPETIAEYIHSLPRPNDSKTGVPNLILLLGP
uniref:Uncharacterized protein n=1 Tax=Octopus bimaculoides TaxID=37653 RepID=A0A0L8GB72_OCTBM